MGLIRCQSSVNDLAGEQRAATLSDKRKEACIKTSAALIAVRFPARRTRNVIVRN